MKILQQDDEEDKIGDKTKMVHKRRTLKTLNNMVFQLNNDNSIKQRGERHARDEKKINVIGETLSKTFHKCE
jgi:hypothetical protein